jgi:predicted GNAT family acetyltransferase
VTTVADNPAKSRYEARVDGELAGWLEYLPAGDSVILAHTEALREGTGLGGTLVREAIEAIRAGGKHVIPTCPFAAAYIGRHQELVDFVTPSMQAQFRR